MKVSIVIINRNRDIQLEKSLHFLSKQLNVTDNEFEIIVIDDSSTDKSRYIISKYKKILTNMRTYFFDSNENWNASKLRNKGIELSEAELITFLDVDMIIPQDFISILINKHVKITNKVILHYLYGFKLKLEDYESKELDCITPENIYNVVKEKICFADYRDNVFINSKDNLSKVYAPWVYAWSGAITVPKVLIEKSGGFDEKFDGWGGEDTDFAYRLYQSGAIFCVDRQAFAVHLPHKITNLTKAEQSYKNRVKIHEKYKTLETELYIFFTGIVFNNIISMINNIELSSFNPIYGENLFDKINKKIKNKKSLCIGIDSKGDLDKLEFSHVLCINEKNFNNIQDLRSKPEAIKSLGLATMFNDQDFDVIVIFDSYRFIPAELKSVLYNEMRRIGKSVYQVETRNYKPPTFNTIYLQEYNKTQDIDTIIN